MCHVSCVVYSVLTVVCRVLSEDGLLSCVDYHVLHVLCGVCFLCVPTGMLTKPNNKQPKPCAVPLSVQMQDRVKKSVYAMAAHINSVLRKEYLAGMILNFRLDPKGHLWFLWADSLRTKSKVCGFSSPRVCVVCGVFHPVVQLVD